ncbi:ABC transporter permease [Ammoniphilus sp. 3BR4]|uniref:ABC transporter permease n=1 Tax=Ammoniphilus sp. 3BR4 TaxID=3158265 RepID=UPI003466D199
MLVADKFYVAHQLQQGQKIHVVIEEKQVELAVGGSGQSPEYLYAVKDAHSITPDPKVFEIAYIPYEDMEMLFSQKGLVNDVSFTLEPGVTFEDVEQKLKSELERYELESLYPAKDQISNAILTEELKQLESMSGSLPLIFLGIAAIILYIMLKRMVEAQRGQIGTMKAFGYGRWEILTHYLSYGLFIGVLGGALGGLAGTYLSMFFTEMYQTYYSLPNLESRFSMKYFMLGVLMSTLFSLAASFQGTKGVLKLKPAEAIRPDVPVFRDKSWLEKIPAFWNLFNVQGRMAIRNALRNKGRTIFTFIGVVFSFILMASFASMGSMADIMIMDQFTKVQKQDVKMSFSKPLPLNETIRELQQAKGVHLVEPMLEVPVQLRFVNHKKDVVALGIKEGSTLYHVFDKSGTRLDVPKTGLMLSEQVAEKLVVRIGDVVLLDSIWAKDEKIKVKIEQIVPQYIGANVYMNQDFLLRLLKQGDMATSALLSMDSQYVSDLKDQYGTSKFVSNIEIRQEMIDKYQQLIGSSAFTLWVMAVMAVVTGFAIVYNSSIISLAERKRDLASLRVMGMTPREVMEVISVEQWLIGVLGMMAGIPLAIAMNQAISKSMSSDLYTLPAMTSTDALLQAAIGTMLAIWISQMGVSRKVKQLDLVEVLKERD